MRLEGLSCDNPTQYSSLLCYNPPKCVGEFWTWCDKSLRVLWCLQGPQNGVYTKGDCIWMVRVKLSLTICVISNIGLDYYILFRYFIWASCKCKTDISLIRHNFNIYYPIFFFYISYSKYLFRASNATFYLYTLNIFWSDS